MHNISLSVVTIAVVLMCSVTGYGNSRTEPVEIGTVSDFPPGSVTFVSLPTSFLDHDPPARIVATEGEGIVAVTQPPQAEISPVPVLLVHDAEKGFIAFYAREPHLGCRVEWDEAHGRLVSPCLGVQYTLAGDCIAGPCQRNLDRFGVLVSGQDKVSIDLQDFHMGSSLPTAIP